MRRVPKPMFFVVVIIIAGLSLLAYYGLHFWLGDQYVDIKGAKEMRFGIDIRGGVDAVFEPADKNQKVTEDNLESARAIIETRLDGKNILDRDVTIDKVNKRIVVRFPWQSTETSFDPEKAIQELGSTARLTFKDPDGNVIIEGSNVVKATAIQGSGEWEVKLELNSEGAKKFADATAKLVGKQISIYLDTTLKQSPTVEEAITGGEAYITKISTKQEAKELANTINAGRLPFDLVSKNHSEISPTLGDKALDVMVLAGFIAFILICIFMLVYYRIPGLVAVIALVFQIAGILLATSVPQITLTLPGIAGIILSIGMGVDANVISAERIKEELRNGKTLIGAIDAGFDKAFSAIFDGNITVIIVAILLMIFGSGAMLSFGYSLLAGVIMNFLAGVTASRLMLKSISRFGGIFKNTFLYGNRRTAK